MKSFAEIENFLNTQSLGEKQFTLQMKLHQSIDAPYYEVADAYVEQLGLKKIWKQWNEIDRAKANDLLVKLLHKTLAYDVQIMELKTAQHISKALFGLFDPWDSTFVTNGTITENESFGWVPITTSTFELALIIYDKNSIAFICVEDED